MSKKDQHGRTPAAGNQRLYELEVSILSGPVTDEFAEANPVVSRTIQIRGDQTLAKLHEAIFDAFDRDDEHMYEFQVGGKRPMDPKARRYVLPMDNDPFDDQKPAGMVTRTTIDALGLKKGQAFGYWFDFGDDWWHTISVVAIHEGPDSGKYPCVTARTGESPPQYQDWDDEDEDDEDDDGEYSDEE
jgi:hypothetical protein